MKNKLKRSVGLFLGILALMGCSARTPEVVEKLATISVVETRIVEVTRAVEKTVVVTATPVPTPAYASKINTAAGTLAYPIPSDPISLAPQDADDLVSQLVTQQLYEGLFYLRGDGSTVPAAATGFSASPDSTVYTVTLRSGLTWSDGQPVTAEHYVAGVCRLLDPAVGNPYYYLLTDIAGLTGARSYASGEVTDCNKVGITAVDVSTLRLTLDRPAAFLPKLLTMPLFWPAPPVATQPISDTAATASPTLAELPANGPYMLAEQVPGDHITLAKNPHYWNAAQVAIERVEFQVVPDLARQLTLYERGDLHVAEFPAPETQRIEADPAFAQELRILLQPGVSYLGLNTQAAPTDDLNVRRAIASAIDRQTLIADVLKQPWHTPAQTLIPPDLPGHQDGSQGVGYPYDPETARNFLKEAGYGPDKPIPPVELWFNREGNNEALFKAVGAMLEEVGIPVRLVSSEWNIYLDALDACNKPVRSAALKTPGQCSYNLYRMGWVMDYADPSALLDVVFSPQSAFQYTGWQSDDYGQLLAKALAEPDEAVRTGLYQQAETLLLTDQVAVVPLQYYDRTVLVKDGVTFDFPPFGPPNLQYWKLPQE